MRKFKAKGEFKAIPRAGNNQCLVDTDYARELVGRLDLYERTFMDIYHECADTKEAVAHLKSLTASGLLERGLATARAYAGKNCSFRPGVFFPKDQP